MFRLKQYKIITIIETTAIRHILLIFFIVLYNYYIQLPVQQFISYLQIYIIILFILNNIINMIHFFLNM